MSGWTKLFSSIVTSSLWVEDDAILRVWIAMLATADAEGIVEGSIPGFANLARVTAEQMRTAVVKLTSPDPDSRTPDHEGRRIEVIKGGWRILNYRAHRERGQAKDGSKAPAMREYRRRQRAERAATGGNALPTAVTRDPEERGEKTEAEKAEEEGSVGLKPSSTSSALLPGSPLGEQPSADDVLRLWNEVTTLPIPRCRELTLQRQRAAAARLREHGLDGLRTAFQSINRTPFLRGENDRGWTATFDWALKPANLAKVLDGNYERTRGAKGAGRTGPPAPGKYDGFEEATE